MKVLTELSLRFLPIARRILAQASNKSMKKILLKNLITALRVKGKNLALFCYYIITV